MTDAKNPKYNAVVFDWDDTLVETRLAKWAHHRYVAKKFYDIDLTDAELLLHWGKPFHVLLGELYKNSDTPENMLEANTQSRDDFPKKVYPGSVGVVTKLLGAGIRVGLLSAAAQRYIWEDLAKFNFPVDRFSMIQGPDDTKVHKPDPKVFAPILEKFKKEGIEKNEIVYVGDSMTDMQAAHSAGIDFIAVTTGLYSRDDFKKAEVKCIAEDVRGIIKYII